MTIYCRNCGKELGAEARFCPACGAPVYQTPPVAYVTASRLVRPRAGRMVSGVCQGLANAYVWDVTWVRVITVLLTVFGGGMGLIAYVIFWIVMPEEPLALPPGISYAPPAGSTEAYPGPTPGNPTGGQ